MARETHSYTNKDIKVIWKPALCIHSRLCWTQLRSVFNPSASPWINMEGADTQRIMDQVKKCPSGALSFEMLESDFAGVTEKKEGTQEVPVLENMDSESVETINIIECLADGPLLAIGKILIKNSDGTETLSEGKIALCRCGGSSNKPFCDGTHRKNDFKA